MGIYYNIEMTFQLDQVETAKFLKNNLAELALCIN